MKKLFLALCLGMPFVPACASVDTKLNDMTEEQFAQTVLITELAAQVITIRAIESGKVDPEDAQLVVDVLTIVTDSTYGEVTNLLLTKAVKDLELQATDNEVALVLLLLEQVVINNGGFGFIEVNGSFQLADRTKEVIISLRRGVQAAIDGASLNQTEEVQEEVAKATEGLASLHPELRAVGAI